MLLVQKGREPAPDGVPGPFPYHYPGKAQRAEIEAWIGQAGERGRRRERPQ